jgi:aldehyde dehydrogenase (NAD+)
MTVDNSLRFYIDGTWVEPVHERAFEVCNPATEETIGRISLGSAADVDRAVNAARGAFDAYSLLARDRRIALLERIVAGLMAHREQLARTVTMEMGCPISFSAEVQVPGAIAHFNEQLSVLKSYTFEDMRDGTLICREPIGVCALITPWNFPLMQIAAKVAPALAAGCTVVLKPSELSPLSATMFAEILDEAEVPHGVFNLVHGDGLGVGAPLSAHSEVDMVSFTGSTRTGISIAKAAADTVKRVTQELGGKSADLILDDADLTKVVPPEVVRCFVNAGQNCQAPTRLLVHRTQREAVVALAEQTASQVRIGDPMDPRTTMGPLISRTQFNKVQDMIRRGIEEGATLVCGGLDRPAGYNRGYFVRPTVFADVTASMAIATDEIFGPVLSIISYDTQEQAIAIANASRYGLAGFVQTNDIARARDVATRIRAGRVYLNGAPPDRRAPFGGYKQSGNGRENGIFGFEEFLEIKAIMGYRVA